MSVIIFMYLENRKELGKDCLRRIAALMPTYSHGVTRKSEARSSWNRGGQRKEKKVLVKDSHPRAYVSL
jgi:hypothetical protein